MSWYEQDFDNENYDENESSEESKNSSLNGDIKS